MQIWWILFYVKLPKVSSIFKIKWRAWLLFASLWLRIQCLPGLLWLHVWIWSSWTVCSCPRCHERAGFCNCTHTELSVQHPRPSSLPRCLYSRTESTVTFLETSFTILNPTSYLFLLNCVTIKAHTINFSNIRQCLLSPCYVPRTVKWTLQSLKCTQSSFRVKKDIKMHHYFISN